MKPAEAVAQLSDAEVLALVHDWEGTWARPEQLEPQGAWWSTWLVKSGRGWGKTRVGAQTSIKWAKQKPIRLHLVARTRADIRDTMVEGESGIVACSPPDFRPIYETSKRRLTWPNGTIGLCFSADEPDELRGPQCHKAWADEVAAWRYAEAWENLEMGCRLGDDPKIVATTTPKPTHLIRSLVRSPMTAITHGTTYDNIGNLSEKYRQIVIAKYEGTTRGRQELHGELLEETPGALWSHKRIEANRRPRPAEFRRIVVGVDPSASSGEDSAETGIIVEGLGFDGEIYTLADLSLQGSPGAWGAAAVEAFIGWKANDIVAEANNGGEMVAEVVKTAAAARKVTVSINLVYASRGKQTRAEPVAALCEQNRAHHCGVFKNLEDQMCNWVPGEKSPDRMDAKVWASTDLMGGGGEVVGAPGEEEGDSKWPR